MNDTVALHLHPGVPRPSSTWAGVFVLYLFA